MTRQPEPTQSARERVLLCGVLLPGQEEEHDGPLSEARSLAGAAGSEVVGQGVIQRRDAPDPATMLGRGKVAEVSEALRELDPDAVVVDNDLAPAQVRNLEKAWGVRVIDRSELIMDIFARGARTRQARLQVELAQVEYLLPRLRRMWTHLERFEGGIGMRGPGETQLETDRRLLKQRIQALKRDLAVIERRAMRQVRSREALLTVGLVGYTNAGKSTLLNRLTGARELVADRPFATLDTRTRKWRLPDGRTVLLSDTVGFLQRLPHHLVASFHATLEEALQVDFLVHVVDASHPDAASQLAAVDRVLAEIGRLRPPDLVVLNKVDRMRALGRIPLPRASDGSQPMWISARTGEGLDELAARVTSALDERTALIEVSLPLADGRTAAQLRAAGKVLAEACVGTTELVLTLRLPDGAMGLLHAAAPGGVRWRVLEPAREPLLAGEIAEESEAPLDDRPSRGDPLGVDTSSGAAAPESPGAGPGPSPSPLGESDGDPDSTRVPRSGPGARTGSD